MKPLYVITPTGDRPEAFSLCVKYMNRQTRKPYRWIIVDDGKDETVSRIEGEIEVPHSLIRLEPMSGHSLCRNLREALSAIPDTASVCVMEDDDWYPDNYVEELGNLLDAGQYVSVRTFNAYNVPTRQYRVIKNAENGEQAAMHCSGFSGTGLKKLIDMLGSTDDWGIDTAFSRDWHGATTYNEKAVPVHITGFGSGRPGTTPSHRLSGKSSSWTEDAECSQLYKWIGDDVHNYASSSNKVYIFSNVKYPEEKKIVPDKDDLLVFLNTAQSIDYYADHENKIVYHRTPLDSYGEERLCVRNRYVFDAGMLSIPKGPLDDLEEEYDWDYPISAGSVRSATTGYMVTKYMRYEYPLREVVLVNFGFSVAKSTYRCPWHNWIFENSALAKYRHVFTADVRDGECPEAVKASRYQFASASERALTAIFVEEGCDQMTRHDYGAVYDRQFSLLRGRSTKIACICRDSVSNIKALVRALPDAAVFGIGAGLRGDVRGAVLVDGDAYSEDAWKDIPRDLDLIIDDGTHKVQDMLRGIPVFLSHLCDTGTLMIEDVPTEEVVDSVSKLLPDAECYRTTPTSNFGDDRVLVYHKGFVHGKLRKKTDAEITVTAAFSKAGSDRVTRHDYGEVYSRVLAPLMEDRESRIIRIAEVGGFRGTGLKAFRSLFQDAELYAVAPPGRIDVSGVILAMGDGYSPDTWKTVRSDLDLIVEDGSHAVGDIVRGIPVFVEHLARGGVLLIEDIKTEDDVSRILSLLPDSVCYRTTPISEYGDDRIVLYTRR